MPETVTTSTENGLTTVRLQRPHGNAINAELAEELAQVVRAAAVADDVNGLMLAADGKLFCPGLDLRELIELDRSSLRAFVKTFTTCVAELYAFPKPMVAAIHGHAVAGGCVLVLAADWRVLKVGSLVGLNEVRVGVPLPFGVAQILRESVPRVHLEEIALLGRNYTDEEALRTGLVHELHPGDAFEAHCAQRLAEFASRDPQALATTKRYLRSATLERIQARESGHVEEFLEAWFRPSTQARIREIVRGLRDRR